MRIIKITVSEIYTKSNRPIYEAQYTIYAFLELLGIKPEIHEEGLFFQLQVKGVYGNN